MVQRAVDCEPRCMERPGARHTRLVLTKARGLVESSEVWAPVGGCSHATGGCRSVCTGRSHPPRQYYLACMPRMRVEIAGMRTVHCVRAVFTALTGVPGIESAQVDRSVALIDHDGSATEQHVRDAVGVVGYEVTSVVEERRGLTVLPSEDGG